MAGAGTGKSFTFKKLLERAPDGDRLVITFINNLVSGLRKELGSLADARTFHSFCKKLLHTVPSPGITTHFHFFPKLNLVVTQDANFLNRAESLPNVDFPEAFQTLTENDGRIDFFLERASFYDAVTFDDSVFRVLKYFLESESHIPNHSILLVDEFQDFNQLEVAFIGCLEKKASTVIVGDDDQAVYDFRNATPQFLRDKSTSTQYKKFILPFCSRCTSVVVEATHDVIKKALGIGRLQGRISKPYVCYEPDKKADSEEYPKIIRVCVSANKKKVPYVAKYITNVLKGLPKKEVEQASDSENGYPLALVIGPPDRYYLKMICDELAKEFRDVLFLEKHSEDIDPLDGYRILLKDPHSNLGWRILAACFMPERVAEAVVTSQSDGRSLEASLPNETVTAQLRLLRLITKALEDKSLINENECAEIEKVVGKPLDDVIVALSEDKDEEDDPPERKHPLIQLCTYNGAKGLSGGFVFILGMEEGSLPKVNNSPSDKEVCQFIVALTRTRKQCHLISVRVLSGKPRTPSVLPDWIKQSIQEYRLINKDTFKKS